MDNQQPSNKTHYVYISFSQHRAYIGLRSCFGDPYLDDYLGSYTDKTFKPTWKWVYGTYKTRAKAHLAETECIKLFPSSTHHTTSLIKNTLCVIEV